MCINILNYINSIDCKLNRKNLDKLFNVNNG